MLTLRDVARAYGDRPALEGVSLDVRPGEIVGLLGANGAGKSTLLRIAAGVQLADRGHARIGDVDSVAAPVEYRRRLGYAAEAPRFHDELSGREHLAFVCGVRALPPDAARARVETLLARLGLADRADEPVRGWSHGMRGKLSFAAAVVHAPAVILCDEALEGFDAASAIAAKEELRARAAAGAAVLFSSHVTESLERLCDRVVILRAGRVAKTLLRIEWGDPEAGPTPLEREFLAATSPAPVPEIVR